MENNIIFKHTKKLVIAIIAILILVIALIIYFTLTDAQSDAAQETEDIVYSVEVLVAKSIQESDFLTYAGIIQSDSLEEVTFANISEITDIYVEEGDYVVKGQRIVTIDDEATQERVDLNQNTMDTAKASADTARANLDKANIELAAAVQARDNNPDAIAAKANLDAANANVATAQAELDNINTLLEPYEEALANAQTEYDTSVENLSAAQTALDSATLAQQTAQAEHDAFMAANPGAPDTDPGKIEVDTKLNTANTNLATAQSNFNTAQTEENTKETALRTAQANLVAEELRLGKAQAETELQTANASVATNQALYTSATQQAQLEVDARSAEVNAYQIQYDNSVAAYERAQTEHTESLSELEDLTYYAKASGTVLAVVGNVGSIATPLAPVVVIGSDGMVAEFGVSALEAQDIKEGDSAIVNIKGIDYNGEILSVSPLPNEQTRTYLTRVLIDLAPDDLLIGELVSVEIITGDSAGVWLPINIILNDGESYVFAVEDGKAVRKDIEIVQINNDEVLVRGIMNGEQIISQGMKTIKNGYTVTVVE